MTMYLKPNETHLPLGACPHCGKANDRTSAADGSGTPTAGDLSLCIGCTGIAKFNEDLSLRRLTLEELRKLMATTAWAEIERLQRDLRKVMQDHLAKKSRTA